MLERVKNKYFDIPFFKRVLALILPLIIQQTVMNFVSLLDNIMVGQLGTEPMSGVAICNQLIFVSNLAVFGSVSAGGIFGAQFFGKRDFKGWMYSFRFKQYACAVVVLVSLVLCAFFNEPLISLYLNEGGGGGDLALTMQYAKGYLGVVMWSIIPFTVANIYNSCLREMEQTFVPMAATTVAVATNAILDYIMIFGLGPVPAMGVTGAAYATLIARIAECAIVVIWTHSNGEKCLFVKEAYSRLGIPLKMFREIMVKGAPLMLNELLWGAGMAAVTQCYAYRGLEVMASLNIASTINNLFSTIYFQLGAGISIVVGQLLGAGKKEEAVEADDKLIFFSILFGTVIGLGFAALGRIFPGIYNTSAEVKLLAADFITVMGFMMPVHSMANGCYFTLRSGGKTIITFLFDSAHTWMIMLPAAFYLSRFTSLPIRSVYILAQTTDLLKILVGYLMVKSKIWVNNIVDSTAV